MLLLFLWMSTKESSPSHWKIRWCFQKENERNGKYYSHTHLALCPVLWYRWFCVKFCNWWRIYDFGRITKVNCHWNFGCYVVTSLQQVYQVRPSLFPVKQGKAVCPIAADIILMIRVNIPLTKKKYRIDNLMMKDGCMDVICYKHQSQVISLRTVINLEPVLYVIPRFWEKEVQLLQPSWYVSDRSRQSWRSRSISEGYLQEPVVPKLKSEVIDKEIKEARGNIMFCCCK